MSTPGTTGCEWSNVDRSGQASEFMRLLDELGAMDFLRLVEEGIVARLEVRSGCRYLDVGCGTGDDVRGLASLVGPAGAAVGVDSSEAMIAEARKRADSSHLPVAFRQADVHDLPFDDGSFDGCRAERVLQHVVDPQRAVQEMARVTRSGGRVVAFEPDWGAYTLDVDDRTATRAVLDARSDSIRNDWIGRQLPRLFRRAGLAEIMVEPMTSTQTDFGHWMALFAIDTYTRQAQEAELVTGEAVAAWLEQLAQADREGTFFFTHTCFLVSARKP